jgi:hypothetical protein
MACETKLVNGFHIVAEHITGKTDVVDDLSAPVNQEDDTDKKPN